MMYVDFAAGGKEYKLRLNTRGVVLLEKELGCNPVLLFVGKNNQSRVPTVEEMMIIFNHTLKAYQPNLTIDDAYDIFDKWIEEGHIITEFVAIIVEVYRQSGLFKKEEADEKNA